MSVLGLDSQRALETVRRRLAGAPQQAAQRFARVVNDSPDHRLEQLMRSPARRLVLEGIFWQMPQHLDRKRAAGTSGVIRWQITGGLGTEADTYQLQIADGRARVLRGSGGPESRVTITVDGAEFLRLAAGNLDPMKAYFSGRIKIAGDIMLA